MTFFLQHPSLLAELPLALFGGMLLMLEVGRRIGRRRLAMDPEAGKDGMGALEGSVYGLLALLVAFTFGEAATRFDNRRDLVVQEALALGDAWARIEALPPETQVALRDGFRRYVDSRIETYRLLPDLEAAMDEMRRSHQLQDEIWRDAVKACALPEGQRVTMLVLPAFDSAFDMTVKRMTAAMQHPPAVIYILLVVLALTSALIAGVSSSGAKRRGWFNMIGYAAATALALYVILDLEFPRVGLIRLDPADKMLVEVRDSMK